MNDKNSIPGIPDGFEAIAFREVKHGETYLYEDGRVVSWMQFHTSCTKYVIVRKIEKPKQYRQFANAEEFKPFRDRWWRNKGRGSVFPPSDYADNYHCGSSWGASFINKVFDDGSPFGVEVNE